MTDPFYISKNLLPTLAIHTDITLTETVHKNILAINYDFKFCFETLTLMLDCTNKYIFIYSRNIYKKNTISN